MGRTRAQEVPGSGFLGLSEGLLPTSPTFLMTALPICLQAKLTM